MTAHAGKDLEKEAHLLMMWVQTRMSPWKSVWQFPRKLGISIFLGIYLKGFTSYYRDTSSSMFIAALFKMTRNWRQPRCLSADWMDNENMMNLHSRILFSCLKKFKIMKRASKWMVVEKNQTTKGKYWIFSLIRRY